MMNDFTTLAMLPLYAQQALIAGAAVGVVCSLLSVIVVLKRMAFIGQGISHAGFGGVGLAAFVGVSGLAQDGIVLTFCLITAMVIGILSRKKRVEIDTAIGILLVATMAFGVVMHNLRVSLMDWPAYASWIGSSPRSTPWEQILFGSPWTVGSGGMWAAIVMAGVTLVVGAALFKEWLFFTFDESASKVFGVPTGLMYYLLLILLTLIIVVSIRLVGFILVSALLIVPGASAMMLSRRMGVVLSLSVILGTVGTVGGLWISYQIGDISPGACIVLLLFGLFIGASVVGKLTHVE